jgi:hypothetical protein
MAEPCSAQVEHTRAQRLLDWFSGNGGMLCPDVAVQFTAGSGFQLKANKEIPAHTRIVTCPLQLSLSYLNLCPDQNWVPYHYSPLQKLLGKVPNHVLGYLLLVEQLVLEESSPWAAYIDTLPDPGELVTALTHDSVHFQDTPLYNARIVRRKDLKADHKRARQAMVDAGMRETDIYEECDL